MKKLLLTLLGCLAFISANATYYVIGAGVQGQDDSLQEWELGTNAMTDNGGGVYTWTGQELKSNFKINEGSWTSGANIGNNNGQKLQLGVDYIGNNSSDSGNIEFDEFSTVKNPTVKLVVSGSTYTITVTGASENSTVYTIAGTFNGWGANDTNYQLNPKGNNQYEGTFELSGGFEFKVVLNGSSWYGYYDSNNANINMGNNGPVTKTYGSGDNFVVSGWNTGDITFLLDTSANTITLTGIPGEFKVPDTVYMIGNVNGYAFAENEGVAQTSVTDGVFTFSNITVAADSQDGTYGYFSFTAGDLSSWTTINGQRFSPTQADQLVSAGSNVDVDYPKEGSWKILPGTYNFTLDVKEMQLSVAAVSTEPAPEPVIDLYVMGFNVNGVTSWSASDDTKMTYNKENNQYTWEGETLGSGFKIADENWSDQYNFGSNGEVIIKDQSYSYTLNGGNIFFNQSNLQLTKPVVTLDLDEKTITISGGEFELAPTPTSVQIKGIGDNSDTILATLVASETNPNIFTGTLVNLTPTTGFKLVTNDNQYYFGWNSFPLYSNLSNTVSLVGEEDTYITNVESDINVTLNWANGTVLFEGPDQPVFNPETMWLVGPFNGWNLDIQDFVLEQTGDNNGIYTGTFELDSDYPVENSDATEIGAKFKIAYGTEDDWSETFGNITSQPFALYTNEVVTSFKQDGSNWEIYNWEKGELTVTIDINEGTVTISSSTQPKFAAPTFVTLMGSFDEWDDGVAMEAAGDGSFMVKQNIVGNDKGVAEFKIVADDQWFGPVKGQNNVALTLNTEKIYEMSVEDNGNWILSNWKTGDITFVATFTETGATLALTQTSAVDSLNQDIFNDEEVIFNLQGVRVDRNRMGKGIYIINGKKVMVK